MEIIKNQDRKVVCYADAKEKKVEIVRRGYKTTLIFKDNNEMEIINSKVQ